MADQNDATLPPVVFKWPGLSPDICLKVFHQEYHVHSVLLKLHFAFFMSFLDSPDKQSFQYEWVTEVDGDGEWHLTATSGTPQTDFSAFKDQEAQQQAFEKILQAIYSKPYVVDGCEELFLMIDLADYHHCLPILSHSMSSALLNSIRVHRQFGDDWNRAFAYAAKLRIPHLFRDLLIHMVNPWSTPRYMSLSDPNLKKAGQRGYDSVGRKLVQAHQMVLRYLALGWDVGLAAKAALVPKFFRATVEKVQIPESHMKGLLSNLLALDKNEFVAGDRLYADMPITFSAPKLTQRIFRGMSTKSNGED